MSQRSERMDENDGEKGQSETEPPPSRDWADLTYECLTNILARLSLDDLWLGPMLACKAWLHACKDPTVHTSFDLETRFASLHESPIWWTREFEHRVDSMLRSVVEWSDGNIVEIRTRHCSHELLSFAALRCPKLEVLSIKSCPNAIDSSLVSIASRCPMLREVDISYCYEITADALALLGKNCPNLKIFKRNLLNWLDPSQHVGIIPDEYLNACPQDGDSEADLIGKSMPRLEHLEIRFSKISSKGLVLITEGCPNLEYLDVFGCANVTARDLANAWSKLKKLKEIKRPNFYIPRSVFLTERYGHWTLYDERFRTDSFRI